MKIIVMNVCLNNNNIIQQYFSNFLLEIGYNIENKFIFDFTDKN